MMMMVLLMLQKLCIIVVAFVEAPHEKKTRVERLLIRLQWRETVFRVRFKVALARRSPELLSQE